MHSSLIDILQGKIINTYVQSHAAMILRPGQIYNFYLSSTLMVFINILHGLFGALEIFAYKAHAPMASLWHGSAYVVGI